jgi:general secretion pathway protein F
MPTFRYQALDASGRWVQGKLEAVSEKSVRHALRQQALIPLKVDLYPGQRHWLRSEIAWWPSRIFSHTALVIWTQQLASLVSAGLPLEPALSALSEQADNAKQSELTNQLRAEVNAGAPLAQALAMHPREFNERYVAVMRSGEQTGQLAQVLQLLANDLQAQHEMRAKLLSASLYPAIVTGVALLMVVFLLTYVVPQVAQVFTSTQRHLPGLTVFMLTLSHGVQAMWVWALLALLLVGLLLHWGRRHRLLRQRMDAALLQLPVIGRLSLNYHTARFASTLALLVGAGVPMLKALQTAAQTLSNAALRLHAEQSIDLVREGAPLATALSQNNTLPGLLPMFARLGEQTGQLPQMLQHAADHLGKDVQRRALQLATVLEPLLIVTMGAVVMLIVLAVMLPLIQLNQFVR